MGSIDARMNDTEALLAEAWSEDAQKAIVAEAGSRASEPEAADEEEEADAADTLARPMALRNHAGRAELPLGAAHLQH